MNANLHLRAPSGAALLVLGLCCALSPLLHATEGKEEYLYLNKWFDSDGFVSNPTAKDGNFGRSGSGFLSGVLPSRKPMLVRTPRFGQVRFLVPDTTGANNNMVACRGQRIPVRTKKPFNTIFILGSAHNGDPSGWLELEFEDGSKARSPFGLSDWYDVPVHGEEVAVGFAAFRDDQNPRGGVLRLWLQHSPIPEKKLLRGITLPELENAKILALSLGDRPGLTPIRPTRAAPLEEADIAVLSAKGFPYSEAMLALDPAEIRDHLREAGLRATLVDYDQLNSAAHLSAERTPVLVLSYGASFPFRSLDALRRFRSAGGVMVHLSAPFRRRCDRSPYGTWHDYRRWSMDNSWADEYTTIGNADYLGTSPYVNTPSGSLRPSELLRSLGFTDAHLAGHRAGFEQPDGYGARSFNLSAGAEVFELTPLLSFNGDPTRPYAAVFEYLAAPQAGAIDICLGTGPLWKDRQAASKAIVLELILRSSAWALTKRERLDADGLKAIVERPLVVPAPVAVEPVLPQGLENPFPLGTSEAKEVLLVELDDLRAPERILVASAQGLLARDGETAAYLVERDERAGVTEELEARGSSVRPATIAVILEALGHRRAIVVDPARYGSLNLATMVAALEGTLVAYPNEVADHGLEVALDLRGMFGSRQEMLEFTFTQLWPRFSPTCLAIYPPVPEAYELRDYLIAQKIFTFWLPSWADRVGGEALPRAERAAIAKLLAASPVATPVIGSFGNGETLGHHRDQAVSFLSRYGKYYVPLEVSAHPTLPATARNLSYWARQPQESAPPASNPPPAVAERGKIYLALVESIPSPTFLSDRAPAKSSRPLGRTLETAALLDLFPERSRPRATGGADLGAGELGLIDRQRFGGAFPLRRGQVLASYAQSASSFRSRNQISFLSLDSSWDLERELEVTGFRELLPASAIIRSRSAPGQNPLDSVKTCGQATLLATFSQAEIAALFEDEKTASALAARAPLFLATTPAALEPVENFIQLPDCVEFVSPQRLGALANSWHAEYELASEEILPAGSTWRYHDQGKDLGENWMKPGYDDKSWTEGAGEFGYGNDKEKTTLSFGDDAQAKHPTYYFRKLLDTSELPDYDLLVIEFVCDDGCVIYLDGEETTRYIMPQGKVEYATLAPAAASGDAETRWNSHLVSEVPKRGKLTIAVELHQASATSSDLGFDLRLQGMRWKKRRP